MAYRGNIDRVMADADGIVARILSGEASISGSCRQYHVAYETLMRVYRPRTTARQRRRISRRNHSRGGVNYRFRPGHVPWSKGCRGIRLSPATEFKAGCLRGNAARLWRPIGTVTIRRDKRQAARAGRPKYVRSRWIKLRDDGPLRRRWIPLARHLWLSHHGSIPAGHFVVHADGDLLNDALSNLRLVDQAGHLALQMRRDPGMEERRCRRASQAATHRHETGRLLKRSRGGRTVWECAGCSDEVAGNRPPGRCLKCGSSAFVRLPQIRSAVD